MPKSSWLACVVVVTALIGCSGNAFDSVGTGRGASAQGDDDDTSPGASNKAAKAEGKRLGKCIDAVVAPYDVSMSSLGKFSDSTLSAHTSDDRDLGNGLEGRLSLLFITTVKPGRYDIAAVGVSANLHVNPTGGSERAFYAGHEGTIVIESFDEAKQTIRGYVENAVFLEEDESYDPIPGGCVGHAARIDFTVEGDR